MIYLLMEATTTDLSVTPFFFKKNIPQTIILSTLIIRNLWQL